MSLRSALYVGQVTHRRVRTCDHRLRYSLFYLLVDLDELPQLACGRLFGVNRWGLLAWRDADHGLADGRSFRDWLHATLREQGFAAAPYRFEVLCLPRVLGYVFNPITVVYCYTSNELVAMLYEVNNTFGERVHYLLPAQMQAGRVTRHQCDKTQRVSPFFDVNGHYQFDLTAAGAGLALSIRHADEAGLRLHAAFCGRRLAWSPRALLGVLGRFPLATLKVMFAIHWEALRLWRKGVPLQGQLSEGALKPHV